MAELVKTPVSFSQNAAALIFTPVTGTDSLTLGNADSRLTVIIRNGNTQDASVTFQAGDGRLSALGDVPVPVPGSGTVAVPFVRVGSARVKRLTGAARGTVSLRSSVASGGSLSALSVAVLSVE